MKKAFVILLLTLAVPAAGFYFGAGAVLDRASRIAIQYLSAQAEERGLEIKEADFQSVSFRFPSAATWRKLSLSGKIALQDLPLSDREFAFTLDEFTLGLESFRGRMLFIKAKGLDVLLKERLKRDFEEFPREGDRLVGDYLETKFQFDFTRPRETLSAAAALAQDLAGLLIHGRCLTFVEFSGAMNFMIDEKRVETDFRVERKGNESVLILDQGDLEKISEELEERLNQTEIRLLSEHPLKVPQLLRISTYAQKAAEEAHEQNPSVPEDAYRHVLWSYLLTKEFGPEFAQQVTTAHERGGMEETDRDHVMDSNNNAIGREYVRKEYPEARILELVLQDPRVIRSAR